MHGGAVRKGLAPLSCIGSARDLMHLRQTSLLVKDPGETLCLAEVH